LDDRGPVAPVEPVQSQRRDLRQPAPRRLEFRAEGQDQQHRQARRPLDRQIEQFARAGIDPVQVLDHHQHWLLAGEGLELMEQRREQLLALALRGQVDFGCAARQQRQQVGDQRDLVVVANARRDQGRELAELLLGHVVVREAGGAFELRDERMERAVLVVRRAEIAQPGVRLAFEALAQRRAQPRFADARLARQQYDLPLTRIGALPAAQQQVQLLLAPDQRRQVAAAQRLEAAFDRAWPQYLPDRNRLGEACKADRPKVAVLEKAAGEAMGGL